MYRAALLASLIVATTANFAAAGILLSTGGAAGSISTAKKNDLVNSLVSTGLIGPAVGGVVNGTFGSQIEFGDSQPGDSLRFSFFGEEAGFNNSFQVKESGESAFTTLFYNNDSRFADSTTDPLGLGSETFLAADLGFDGGILQFRFGINTLQTSVSSTRTFATNGSNPDDSDGKALQNFFVVDVDRNDANGVARNGVLLWLDDGGANNDGDHDDMVVFIEAIGGPGGPSNAPNSMVPEPSSLAMWAVICLGCTSVRPSRRKTGSRSNS